MTAKLIDRVDRKAKEADGIAADRALRKAKAEAADWKRKYEDALEQIELEKARSEFLEEVSTPSDWDVWQREMKARKSKAAAIVLASDWHVGERVDPASVNYKNSYDQEEAGRRIKRFFQKIPEYIDRYVPMAKDLILWAGGDFITGYLHEDQKKSNTMAPVVETLFFREHWNAGIELLLQECKQTITIPTSFGNHSRATPKIEDSVEAHNSYEWLIYNILAGDQRGNPRIKYQVSQAYHTLVEVLGRRVNFSHGHAIRGGGGVGGIYPPLRRVIGEWAKSDRDDLYCMGHFHTYVYGGNFVVNSTLMGPTAYSIKKFGNEPASQTFLVYDGKFGVRTAARIFVTDQ